MIVMIFVTQNNFQNGPGISDRLLGFDLTAMLNLLSYNDTQPQATADDENYVRFGIKMTSCCSLKSA